MKQSIAAATVALGSVFSSANAHQSHVQHQSSPNGAMVEQQDPPFDPFQTSPTPQAQGSQANKSSVDLDVCIGGSVILVGGAAALAMRGKKTEEELLRRNRKKSEEWFEPGREDRRR